MFVWLRMRRCVVSQQVNGIAGGVFAVYFRTQRRPKNIKHRSMKKYWMVGAVLLCLGLSSCQCSNKPEIGPVEEGASAAVMMPPFRLV